MTGPLLELRDVTKTYRSGDETLVVLNQVNLAIAPGTFLAIVGPSGSGKTTLADVIGGLAGIDSGTVTVAGTTLNKARDRALSHYRNRNIGFVFQSFNLQATYTALENVALPLMLSGMPMRKRRARAQQCLSLVGLDDRMHHRPSQLSGGQRQRVAIARALAPEPSIIIADEPTGNLDTARGTEIMSMLASLNKKHGITLLVVTHDPAIAGQADRVLHMQDGVVTEGGDGTGTASAGTPVT
jgi:putative ABC transport system ATP-binding protein